MPTETTILIYTLDELEGRARDKALATLAEWQTDDQWWDFVYDDADAIAQILGIDLNRKHGRQPEIWFRGFYTQGSGACIGGSYSYAKGCQKAIRQYAPQDETLHRIADDLAAAQRKHFYRLDAELTADDRYMSTRVQVYDREDQYRDIDRDSDDAITEAIKDFAAWIFRTLENEYEHLTSEDSLTEMADANGYRFHADGSIA